MIMPSDTPVERRILIVDDEEDAFALMRRLLLRVGATEEIDWFSDGSDLIQHLREIAMQERPMPLLVIVDLKMPGMTGFDVLRAIKTISGLERLFTVVVSSSSLPEDIARALQLGAFCYFEKYPLPEKFARVYQIAKSRLGSPAPLPDPSEAALRRIIDLLEGAIGAGRLAKTPPTEADRGLLDLLGGIRRNATERLLDQVNRSRSVRWPFEAPTGRSLP